MSSMSMPRAATSVATSIGNDPSANLCNTRSRTICGRSPWIASALTPSSSSAWATRSHERFVWQNKSTFGIAWPIAPTTRSLSMWWTARNRWCIVPTVSVAESIATSTGSLR
jgi:hypothetical protein